MRITQEEVLKTVQQLGPVVPNKIKQHLQQSDSMLINVYLSDLQKDGKVRMTHLQLGSSSFAYTPQQLRKVEDLMQHLNEKDRRVARRLKEAGVMRAVQEDPLTRVALKNIKDFAKPMQVRTSQGEEVFYRYYLLPSEQAQERIKKLLGAKLAGQETPKEEKAPEPVQEEQQPQPPKETPKERSLAPQTKQREAPHEHPKAPESKAPEPQSQAVLAEIDAESSFAHAVLAYFKEKHIEVQRFEEVRKDSEIDAIISLPSAVGNITYFCKAKSKKTSNDGDLAAAILTAKSKMLPALYLTTGTVTNKAKENKELQEIVVVELGN